MIMNIEVAKKIASDNRWIMIHLDSYDLKSIVEAAYGVTGWSIVYDQSTFDGEVSMWCHSAPLTEGQADAMKIFVESNGKSERFMLRTIMQDLCVHGVLEPGDYIIHIS